MSSRALLLKQIAYTNRSFWRNPAAAFFTFAFPLMFLVIFNGIFGNPEFFVPGIGAFAIVSASFTNIAMSLTILREEGVLKRTRGTPLPPWVYVVGRVIHAVLIAILLIVIVCAFGALFYDVDPPMERLGEFATSVVVGALAFSALGLAVTAVIPNEDAAPPIVNAAIIPLSFVSGVFVPTGELPDALRWIADFFPLSHFVASVDASFPPFDGFVWFDVAIVAIWGAVGLALAIRFFRWEPRH